MQRSVEISWPSETVEQGKPACFTPSVHTWVPIWGREERWWTGLCSVPSTCGASTERVRLSFVFEPQINCRKTHYAEPEVSPPCLTLTLLGRNLHPDPLFSFERGSTIEHSYQSLPHPRNPSLVEPLSISLSLSKPYFNFNFTLTSHEEYLGMVFIWFDAENRPPGTT